MFYSSTKVSDITSDLAWRKAEIERIGRALASGKARNIEGAHKTIQTHKSEIVSLEREIANLK